MLEPVKIEVKGKNAPQFVERLIGVLADEFKGESQLLVNGQPSEADEAKGWKENLLLVLAIPPALVATIDLANKCDVSAAFDRVITAAKEIHSTLPDVEVRFVLSADFALTLGQANGVEITDKIAQQQKKDGGDDKTHP